MPLRLFASSWVLAMLIGTSPFHLAFAQSSEKAENQRKPLAIVESKRADAIDFESEILPILKGNCLACHNQTKGKADLVLETPQTILKGGESGPAVVPGKSSESLLFKAASHQQKPAMPPKDNKVNAVDLTAEQLGLLKLWIDQGAKGEVRASAPVDWQPLPEVVNPIFAVALTLDGQFAACGRGNQIFVYHIPSAQLAQRLVDPQLSPGNTNLAESQRSIHPAAHLDLVHSLAFSRDGNLLASGGYREVKLWRRPRNVVQSQLQLGSNDLVRGSAFSKDGKWFAAADAKDGIKLVEVTSGTEKQLGAIAPGTDASGFSGNDSLIASRSTNTVCLRFSRDGGHLFAATSGDTLRIWTIPAGNLIVLTNLGMAELTALEGLDSLLATGDSEGNVRLWRLPDETNKMFVLAKEFNRHKGAITCLESIPTTLQRSNAAALIASGSSDGTIRIWDSLSGETVREMK